MTCVNRADFDRLAAEVRQLRRLVEARRPAGPSPAEAERLVVALARSTGRARSPSRTS